MVEEPKIREVARLLKSNKQILAEILYHMRRLADATEARETRCSAYWQAKGRFAANFNKMQNTYVPRKKEVVAEDEEL